MGAVPVGATLVMVWPAVNGCLLQQPLLMLEGRDREQRRVPLSLLLLLPHLLIRVMASLCLL